MLQALLRVAKEDGTAVEDEAGIGTSGGELSHAVVGAARRCLWVRGWTTKESYFVENERGFLPPPSYLEDPPGGKERIRAPTPSTRKSPLPTCLKERATARLSSSKVSPRKVKLWKFAFRC